MEPKFYLIDMKTWPRAQMFYYFSQMAPTGYTINVTVNATATRHALKERGLKFFPAYLYLVTRTLSQQSEFTTAYMDDQLGYWDALTPLYAVFHDDNKTFSFLWTPYNEDFTTFYNSYIEDTREYSHVHGVLDKPDTPPPSCYTVSCVPWISFDGFALHCYNLGKYYFPSVEAGHISESDGCISMPLSLTLHHAAKDGYHVQQFLLELERLFNKPSCWLP